jgi:hypothetical protein
MADPQPARQHDDCAPGAAPTGNGVPAPAPPVSDLVVGGPAGSADDTPTVISKLPPAQAVAPGPGGEVLQGGLRGRRLAHFELLEAIGVGGMAAVLRARDTQLDRVVALKILPPEMAAEPENVRRFHQEARAAAKLDHENIARVFFCGEDQRLHFIAFEFVEGENLRTIVERRGRLPVAEAIHYLVQLAAGLDHAAHRGVVHRDIKPSNIIITPSGRAKLVDMGLARHLGSPGDKGLTQSGVTLGTFDYISPEQALEPRDADVRSDIYSLGCTFYHALTGDAPVPEGTAAKKLHHHQHVAPLDPRVLNPDLPDAVAAILARMMAKDPKDRYQRPEHLVAHLLQVAQQMGVAPEVPEGGVLLVDAPLPSPPQKRVGLLAAVAAVGLVAVLAALSLVPAGPEPVASHSRPAPKPPGDVAVRPGPGKVDEGSAPTPAARPHPVVKNEEELARALKADPALDVIRLEGEVVLDQAGLRINAPRPLTLEGADLSKPAVIRVTYEAGAEADPTQPWAGLLAVGGSITFKNLLFVLQTDQTPEGLVAAVAVTRARRVTFERCAFVQRAPAGPFLNETRRLPAASVAVDSPGKGAKPFVRFLQCYFIKGQTAVTVTGPADVGPQNCAFGPHGALFHLRSGDVGPFTSSVTLNDCSAFVVNGPAFRLDGDGDWSVVAQGCLFSCPDTPQPAKMDDRDLFRQTSDAVRLHFADGRTCYHGLNNYWSLYDPAGQFGSTKPENIPTWEEFRKKFHLPAESDTRSAWLPRGGASPWAAADPLALIKAADPWHPDNREAFRVNPRLPQLRQAESGGLADRPVGVQKCVFGDYKDLPRLPALAAEPGKRVVDPAARAGAGTYQKLAAAVADAAPGDTILIKHTGRLAVDPIRLKAGQGLTVRPFEGYRPVLVLSTRDLEASLFQVRDGQLKFEHLELELAPDLKELKSQAVATLVGGGECSFTDCLITLKGPAGVARHVVAVEASDGKTMPTPEPRPNPRVAFLNCLVRGEGDLVRVPRSRPFELKAENLAVALDGSFLLAAGNPAEGAAVQGEALVSLKQVTTYLTGNLLLLEDKRGGKGLVLTRVAARDCLFASAADKALVHLEGLDGQEQQKRVFSWAPSEHNWYSGFEYILDQQPAMVGPPLKIDSVAWGMNFRDNEEARSHFGKLKLDIDPGREGVWAQVLPPQLRPRSEEAVGYGADLDRLTERLGLPPTAGAGFEESGLREQRPDGRDE